MATVLVQCHAQRTQTKKLEHQASCERKYATNSWVACSESRMEMAFCVANLIKPRLCFRSSGSVTVPLRLSTILPSAPKSMRPAAPPLACCASVMHPAHIIPQIMLLVAKHGSSTTSLVQLWLGGCKASADGAGVRYRDKQQRGNLHV